MRRRLLDWLEIQRYYDAGNDRDACAAHFGFRVAAWYKAIRRGKLRAKLQRAAKFDWAAVQKYYNAGHSVLGCKAEFGFCAQTWSKAVKRGDVISRSLRWPLERI